MPLTREDYKQKFVEFDSSGDGRLTYDEFKKHIEELLRVDLSDAAIRVSRFHYIVYCFIS